MAFADINELIAALPGQLERYSKVSQTSTAGYFTDFFTVTGRPISGATPPTGGESPNKDTPGAWTINNPGTGKKLYLATAGVASSQPGSLIIYDRLAHNSGLAGNITTAQNFTPISVNRPDTTGEDVEIWLVNYGASVNGFTSAACTITYINSQGVTNRQTISGAIGNNTFNSRMAIRLPTQIGDTGVQSASSLIWNTAGASAGNFGIALVRPIAFVSVPAANIGTTLDFAALGLPEIPNNACLSTAWLAAAASTGNVSGMFNVVEG